MIFFLSEGSVLCQLERASRVMFFKFAQFFLQAFDFVKLGKSRCHLTLGSFHEASGREGGMVIFALCLLIILMIGGFSKKKKKNS